MNIPQFDRDVATLTACNLLIANGYHLSGSDRSDLAGALARINKLSDQLSDADKLTAQLIEAGADRAKIIEIIDGYGDSVDWDNSENNHTGAEQWTLPEIIAEVWQSDANSGDDPSGWIINEICRSFNIKEVTE